MELEQRAQQKQQQTLVMSPLMIHSLRILQMPLMELKQHLDQEIIANPVIEEVPSEDIDQDADSLPEYSEETWEDYYRGLSHQEYDQEDEGKGDYLQSLVEDKPGLADHLISQLHISKCENTALGEFIIGNIDEDGYLCMEAADIASCRKVSVETVRNVILLIQSFDPPGVCARDLRECLLIQMRMSTDKNALAERMVESCLDELRKKRFSKISGLLQADIGEVLNAADFISKLNPSPGGGFSAYEAPRVVPDVTIKKVGGEYDVIINDAELPNLRISRFYRDLLDKSPSGAASDFIRKRINSAGWLIGAISKRKSSLRAVSEYLLKTQREFFEAGTEHLSAMKMKEAAEAIGMNESTVSRLLAGKYIETDRGIYPMKHFFSARIDSQKESDLSSAGVKERILGIVGEEDPSNPLSDGDITAVLQSRGIKIARRTVAKYRESLKILPCSLRKKHAT